MSYTLFSPAKINLCLHVTGYNPLTSYHHLESVVLFANWGDVLHIAFDKHFSLFVNGEIANIPVDESNILYKTIRVLEKHNFNIPPLKMTLEKSCSL